VTDGHEISRAPVAALDCGTNSTRLLIVAPGGQVLERRMRITRLGEGVDATRKLSPEAMARTLDVLREYRSLLQRYGVARARLVATSAARDAANAEEFLAAAADACGIEPELLSGEEEGALSFAGATAGLAPDAVGPGPVLVVDIGGGSTELVAGVAPTRTASAAASSDVPPAATEAAAGGPHRLSPVVVSLDMGCVRVTERFLHHDPPTPDELARARAAAAAELMRARAVLPPLAPGGLLVGLAGTVSTLAMLHLGIPQDAYDRERVHHAVLERGDVERWLEVLAHEPRARRLARTGMVRGREDVIVGGVLLLAEVMAVFDRERCLVSEDDILDGLVASLVEDVA